MRRPCLVRLAPEGWRQQHAPQPAVRIGPVDRQCPQASVGGGTLAVDLGLPPLVRVDDEWMIGLFWADSMNEIMTKYVP